MLAELSVTYNMAVMQISEIFDIQKKKTKFTSSMLSGKKNKNNKISTNNYEESSSSDPI